MNWNDQSLQKEKKNKNETIKFFSKKKLLATRKNLML